MTDAVPALKSADGMLQEIIKVVDTDGDGKIQYEGVLCRGPICRGRSHFCTAIIRVD
jgi:hypothetical protein